MKKDDKHLKSPKDEGDSLFDLSLSDLEPEDTIVEDHVDEADEEIIELIDLVEKGDIDLGEEIEEPSELARTIESLKEEPGDDLKTNQTLDLLNTPLDHIDFGQPDESKEVDQEAEEIEISESDLFMDEELEILPEITEEDEISFDDIADESALKELIADETETLDFDLDLEGSIDLGIEEVESSDLISADEKAMKIIPDAIEIPIPVQEMKLKKTEQPEMPTHEEEKVEERPAAEEYMAPAKEETPQMQPPEAIVAGISEEKIEAMLRKIVEDIVERLARETITEVVEKTTRETMADVKERITKETIEMVERVARETTTNVAERVITDAINILKNSIESVSD